MKKLFALILALLLLCACTAEKTPEPVLPEESSSSEAKIEEEPKVLEEAENPEENTQWDLAFEIRYSEKHDEYMSKIQQRLDSYKDGTFEEMPNHHSAYPEDFPSTKNFLPADESNTVLAYRNEKRIDANSWYDGYVDYVYFVDDYHAIILEPAEIWYSDGTVSFGFANTGYVNAKKAGYNNIYEWLFDRYDGYFGDDLKVVEPKVISEHVAALNEVFGETFYTGFDWNDETYARLFKDEQINGTTAEAVPDLMMKNAEISENGIPEGYFMDAGDADCYLIKGYCSKAEIYEVLGEWLSEDIFAEEIDRNMIEYGGKLYMVRGGRGYSVKSCACFVITEQTETEIKALGNFFLHGDPAGKIELIFSVNEGEIILKEYTTE